MPGEDGAAAGVPPAAGAPPGAAAPGDAPMWHSTVPCVGSHGSPSSGHVRVLEDRCQLWALMHGSLHFWRGFGLKQMVLMRISASVQDAAGGHGTAEDSPQIVGSGLSRETTAASADLGSIADTEAEIRRLAEVISVACCASGLTVQYMVPSSTHHGGVSSQVIGRLMGCFRGL